ncbi:MAG: hypothetical protein OEM52_11280, partial [bacterium]|nr:hypothetical protein [bacterium]
MKPHQDSFPMLSRVFVISILLLITLLQTSMAQDSLGVRCVGKLHNYEMWNNATGIVVSGNCGYVATGLTGLRIVDIQNPDRPVEIGHFVTGQSIKDVVLVGNLAILASYEQGIKIVDVSNPSSPFQVGSLDITNTKKIIIEGNLGYALCGQGVTAFTFNQPSNPSIVGTYSPTGSAYAYDVSDTRAYIFSSWYGGSLGSGYRFYYQFSIVSFLTPNNPQILNSSTREYSRYNGIKVMGNTAFIFDDTDIKTYRIDDSLHFNLLGTYDRNPIMPTSFQFCDSM